MRYFILTLLFSSIAMAHSNRSDKLNDTAIGAGIGAIVGSAYHHTGRGAAIGAAAGFILNSISDRHQRDEPYYGGSYYPRSYYYPPSNCDPLDLDPVVLQARLDAERAEATLRAELFRRRLERERQRALIEYSARTRAALRALDRLDD